MECLINAANALYLLAYFLRDMRWLRAFTIVAASLLAGCFFLLPQPVMAAVYWNVLFAALNAVQLLRLVAPARPAGARTRRWLRRIPGCALIS